MKRWVTSCFTQLGVSISFWAGPNSRMLQNGRVYFIWMRVTTILGNLRFLTWEISFIHPQMICSPKGSEMLPGSQYWKALKIFLESHPLPFEFLPDLSMCFPKAADSIQLVGFWENKTILIGGLEHFLVSHILGIIIPIDELIFFRWDETTDQTILVDGKVVRFSCLYLNSTQPIQQQKVTLSSGPIVQCNTLW